MSELFVIVWAVRIGGGCRKTGLMSDSGQSEVLFQASGCAVEKLLYSPGIVMKTSSTVYCSELTENILLLK